MRTLLTFTGSVIYLVVMSIIWPLLLLVYTGLEAVMVVQHLKHQKFHLPKIYISIKVPALQLPVKKYFQTLWTKAVHFHL